MTGGCYQASPDVPTPTVSANVRRLLAVKRLFGLQDSEIARAAGYSRPYVVRLLSNDLEGSPEFYRRLENTLGALVQSRSSQVFDHAGTPVPVDAPDCANKPTSNDRRKR